MLAISFAAVMHRTLLYELTDCGSLCLSALKMPAWCRQIVEVWMLMFMKTMLGFVIPAGNFSPGGRQSDVLSKMLSSWR